MKVLSSVLAGAALSALPQNLADTILSPGDIIATGTPGGVGVARKPPVWLQDDDIVEVDIGPVGCLRNTVCDE